MLVESTSDVLCNFVFIFHWDDTWSNWVVEMVKLGGNPLSLCLVQSVNLGGLIGWKSIEITLYACLVKLGGNPLRLHRMPAWSNWVEIHWDYIVCLPGQIGWSDWVDIHWDYIVCLPGRIGMMPNLTNSTTQCDQAGIQCNPNGFLPNSTTQFIEMMPGRIGW